jgi:hypothetical protein
MRLDPMCFAEYLNEGPEGWRRHAGHHRDIDNDRIGRMTMLNAGCSFLRGRSRNNAMGRDTRKRGLGTYIRPNGRAWAGPVVHVAIVASRVPDHMSSLVSFHTFHSCS